LPFRHNALRGCGGLSAYKFLAFAFSGRRNMFPNRVEHREIAIANCCDDTSFAVLDLPGVKAKVRSK